MPQRSRIRKRRKVPRGRDQQTIVSSVNVRKHVGSVAKSSFGCVILFFMLFFSLTPLLLPSPPPPAPLVVAQGFVGSLSWDVISYIMLWLACMGFARSQQTVVFGLARVGAAVGGLSGGFVGDWAHRRYEHAGRLLVSMGADFVGVPLGIVFFSLIPTCESSKSIFAVLGLIFGLAISWPASACVLPMSSAVVPAISVGTGFAIDRLVEGRASTFGTLAVGALRVRGRQLV
jgi:hypothetical protein